MTQEDAIKWLSNLKNDIGNPHYERLWPYAQAIEEICELLKEQETTYAYNEYTNPACTSCGFRPFAGYIPTLKWMQERGYRYCPGCGKAVKWDG